MEVTYIGNFSVPFSTESHIAKAWENLGHTVQRIPEQKLEWRDLPGMVAGDLLIWTRTAGFDPPNLDFQRSGIDAVHVPVVGVHLDRWWGLKRETTERGPRDPDPSPFFTHVDLLYTAEGGDNPWAVRHEWMPPAILSDEMEPGRPNPKYACDVAFVGNLTDYGHEEWKTYRHQLWGHMNQKYKDRFKHFPGRGRPAIRGRDLADLYASTKVNVGDSCLAGEPTHYWSDRIPETLGRGGYLVHPWVEGLEEQFPYLPTYKLGDWDGLKARIDEALSDPVAREARAGMNKDWVRQRHTYEVRMQRLLELV